MPHCTVLTSAIFSPPLEYLSSAPISPTTSYPDVHTVHATFDIQSTTYCCRLTDPHSTKHLNQIFKIYMHSSTQIISQRVTPARSNPHHPFSPSTAHFFLHLPPIFHPYLSSGPPPPILDRHYSFSGPTVHISPPTDSPSPVFTLCSPFFTPPTFFHLDLPSGPPLPIFNLHQPFSGPTSLF
jgi:hypothetical protein